MELTQEQNEQIAAILTGTTIGSNGKARRLATTTKNGTKVTPLSAKDAANLPAKERATPAPADMPDLQASCEIDGVTYTAYLERVQGTIKSGKRAGDAYDTTKVRVAGMPWFDKGFSLIQLRMLAQSDFSEMLLTLHESLPERLK